MLKNVQIGFLSLLCTHSFAQQTLLKSDFGVTGTSAPTLQNSAEKPKDNRDPHFEPQQFKSLNKAITEAEHEVVLVGKLAPEGVNIYEIPLFGGYQKNLAQLEEDKAFLADCDKNFESRTAASQFFAEMGWQYLSEGSKEMAIYRFNLAHLLDEKNVDVYWGLGVMEYQKGEIEEAIKLMSAGVKADHKFNVVMMVDLATVHLQCFKDNKHGSDLGRASKLLQDALILAPQFANSYIQLARLNMYNNEMDKAWENFHKGYQLDPLKADTSLMSDLLDIQADPKGIFRKQN